MIGIRFKIPNKSDTYISKILKNIGREDNIWYIKEEEILNKMDYLFDKEIYTNSEFKGIISKPHYIVFANIQLYKNNNIKEINNYDDFINSDCSLILFITDSEFVDVYSKEEKFIDFIKQNAIDNEFKDIKIISNESEIRKYFSAYSD